MDEKIEIPVAPSAPKEPWTWNNKTQDFDGLTWESLGEFRTKIEAYHKERKLYDAKYNEILDTAVDTLKSMGFPTSYREKDKKSRSRSPKYIQVQLRYMLSKFIEYYPAVSFYLSSKEDCLKKRAEKKDREVKANWELQRRDKAIQFLISKGKIYGTDFTAENALSIAEDIAYEEEVAREVERIKKEDLLISFSGDDYCEECAGWDGVSRRCECGNRRVYWEKCWNFDYENPTIVATAW